MIRTALVALVTLSFPAFSADYSFELKPETTKIQWTLGDVLHTVHGTFALKRGALEFNTDGKVTGEIVVNVLSGQSGSDARDRRMHANVLESPKFSEAVFVPSRYEGTLAVPGNSTVKIHGTMTLHGAPHEITMDAQTKATAEGIEARITFDVPYVSWGMKDPSTFVLKVNKSVQMTIDTSGSLRKQ